MATIGNTSQSGSDTRALDGGAWRGVSVTFPDDPNTGFSVWAYIADSAGTDGFQAVLVDSADGSTVLAASSVRTDISTAGWYQFTGGSFSTYNPSASQTVYAGLSTLSSSGAVMYYGTGLSYDGYVGTVSGINPTVISTPLAIDGSARDYFVYVEYTTGSSAIINKLAGPFGGPLHKLV